MKLVFETDERIFVQVVIADCKTITYVLVCVRYSSDKFTSHTEGAKIRELTC